MYIIAQHNPAFSEVIKLYSVYTACKMCHFTRVSYMGSAINKLYIKRKINDIKFKIEKKKNKAILRDVLA